MKKLLTRVARWWLGRLGYVTMSAEELRVALKIVTDSELKLSRLSKGRRLDPHSPIERARRASSQLMWILRRHQ